jgi:hypothetical protein
MFGAFSRVFGVDQIVCLTSSNEYDPFSCRDLLGFYEDAELN